MHTINESPICYSLSKSSSDINLQNLLGIQCEFKSHHNQRT